MKLKVLVDNNTFIDQYFYGEPAVAYYIEDEGKEILFDVGYSDLFLKNAKEFNLNIDNIDTIVLSHSHNDHTGGLKYYFQKQHANINLISHPFTFDKRILDGENIGSPLSIDMLSGLCNLILSKEPISISKNIVFLGEIPDYNSFESRKIIGKRIENGVWKPDYVVEDSALVYKGKKGLYIITGCSHSGICNIIQYAKVVCKEEKVVGVIGGFHLFEMSERVKKTIDYFKDNKIEELYPCHCTSLLVKAEIHKRIPVHEVGVGLELEWK